MSHFLVANFISVKLGLEKFVCTDVDVKFTYYLPASKRSMFNNVQIVLFLLLLINF